MRVKLNFIQTYAKSMCKLNSIFRVSKKSLPFATYYKNKLGEILTIFLLFRLVYIKIYLHIKHLNF